MPFMDEPPGAKTSSTASGIYGSVVKRLRGITQKTVNEEPKWRQPGTKLLSGYTGSRR